MCFFYILNNFINWFLFGKQILLNYGWLQLVQVASKTFLFLFWQNSILYENLNVFATAIITIIHIALRRIRASHGFKWQTVSTHLWQYFMSFKNQLENTSHFKSLIDFFLPFYRDVSRACEVLGLWVGGLLLSHDNWYVKGYFTKRKVIYS